MSHVKIGTFNANSIRVRLNQILAWLDTEQIDILAIQETKVQDKDFPLPRIEEAGYHAAFAGQKRSAGVATLSRAQPTEVLAGFDDGSDRARLLCTLIHGVYVVNTYVPQGRDVEHEQPMIPSSGWVTSTSPRRTSTSTIRRGCANTSTSIPKYRPLWRRCGAGASSTSSASTILMSPTSSPTSTTGPGIPSSAISAPLAAKSTGAWIDIDARRAERPSDHTFLVAEFEI